MSNPLNDRPYFENWLRRARKQFAESGRLTQVAMMLAHEEDGSVDEWRNRLRTVLDGEETLSLELLTRIDGMMSGFTTPDRPQLPVQDELF